MDAVFSYDFPPLHALVTSFPVALLLVAVLTSLVWVANGKRFWRQSTLLLSGLGTVGAGVAMITGTFLRERILVTPVVDAVIDHHESFALFTLLTAIGSTAFLSAMSFYLERRTTIQRHPPDPAWIRTIGFLLVLAAGVMCALTAHMGAVMVWTD